MMARPEEYRGWFEAIARTREMAAERAANPKELMGAAERACEVIVSTTPGELSAEQQTKHAEGLETLLAAMSPATAGTESFDASSGSASTWKRGHSTPRTS